MQPQSKILIGPIEIVKCWNGIRKYPVLIKIRNCLKIYYEFFHVINNMS